MAKTNTRLIRISFGGSLNSFIEKLPEGDEWKSNKNIFRTLIMKLEKFSLGQRVSFNEAIDISSGTKFGQRVWLEIKKIPRGETRSYLDIAKAIGQPNACRAVANACGRNPLPIIIPCHRVVSSDGTIGGFSSGIPLKKKLLKLEGLY